ncbi:FixH family protein [Paraflavitalea devenefica]|uniref:FixH family protein n=1 Tax=Paraflavitalea devenefica TaxID=2716334 RepID=UPI00142132D7|nr:FixH family protein [Paraflavitalea devenefica]
MNWGNKLILVFIGFGAMMSFMVYRCMKVPVNLVSKEYYRDEIAYQEEIDSRAKTNALSGKVILLESKEAIGLTLPAEMKYRKVEGNIVLYCPADARYDRQFVLQTDSAASQLLSKETLAPGSYVVKISWKTDGANYYSEEPLTIH